MKEIADKWLRFYQSLMLLAIATAAGIALPFVVPSGESAFFPVLLPMESPITRLRDGRTLIDVRVNKKRNCQYLSQSYILDSRGKPAQRLHYDRPGYQPRTSGSRPKGVQSLGPYVFETQNAAPGDTIRGVVYYKCHDVWDTHANLGPWVVPSLPSSSY